MKQKKREDVYIEIQVLLKKLVVAGAEVKSRR